MTLDPVIPIPWITVAAALALGTGLWAAVHTNRRLGPARLSLLTLVRLLAIAAIVALLLQPSKRESFQPPVRQRSILVALDNSASMQTADLDGATRSDIARETIATELMARADDIPVHTYLFDRDSRTLGPKEFAALFRADGETTHIHSSVERILAATHNPAPAALFLFSDGHDFEGEPPARTARSARAREVPIFTIATGTPSSAPDISLRMASYHPYTFIGQTTRLAASLRVTGFPNQKVVVDLVREGRPAESRTIETGAATYLTAEFLVSEEEAGQYEYTMRVRPMRGEVETENNITSTYLNVVDDKLRVLEIEGSPYWDSTFLRRSLTRNDKFEIDSLIYFSEGRIRAIRSGPEKPAEPLGPPADPADFQPYHLVLLGRDVERVIGQAGITALETWVKEHDGVVVFSRGRAWNPELSRDLEPIAWGDAPREDVALNLSADAGFPPLAILREARRDDLGLTFDALPGASEPKALASVFGRTLEDQPAIVYRRYGQGQTLSLGIANAWRWVFNERTEFDNNAFDRFWDQTVLWLLANRGVTPLEGFSFTANSANIPVGETITFSLGAAGEALPSVPPAVTISRDDRPLSKLTLQRGDAGDALTATYVPEQAGRYLATTSLPDGEQAEIRFISYLENLEKVETAVDVAYLDALATASGGARLEPDQIAATLDRLLIDTGRQDPIERIRPIWPTATVFLTIVLFLSADWYLRRKWGLA